MMMMMIVLHALSISTVYMHVRYVWH